MGPTPRLPVFMLVMFMVGVLVTAEVLEHAGHELEGAIVGLPASAWVAIGGVLAALVVLLGIRLNRSGLRPTGDGS